jgi:hypothetical protein
MQQRYGWTAAVQVAAAANNEISRWRDETAMDTDENIKLFL